MSPRVLGGLELLALGLNGVVGVGIFFLPTTLAQKTGDAGVLVLLGTALALAPVALTFAALGRRFDQDGGPVIYARAAFGDRAAFVVGWVAYLSAVTSSAAVLAGLCRYSLAAWFGLSGLAERGAAVALAAALFALSAVGLSLSARVWTSLTALKLLPLLGLVGLSLWARQAAPAAPLPAPSLDGWAAAALAATFAYQGFEVVPLVAGHARASERAVPRAMIGALLGAALLYALLYRACLVAMPGQVADAKAPLVAAAASLGGAGWASVLGAGTNLSSLGIAFGMVAMTPRYLAALAPDLGEALGIESSRGVPVRAVLISAPLVAALLLLGDLGELFALSSVAVLAQYGVTALALLRLAQLRQRGLRPLDAWPAPFALVAAVALASGASLREAAVASVALALGLGARWLR